MRLIDLERRLAALEAARVTTDPTAILTDRPEGDGPEIRLQDWQAWGAAGLGSVHHGVLTVVGPELTPDQWAARFVTAN